MTPSQREHRHVHRAGVAATEREPRTDAADRDDDARERSGGGDPALRLRCVGLAARAWRHRPGPRAGSTRSGRRSDAPSSACPNSWSRIDARNPTRADDRSADADHTGEAGADEERDDRGAPMDLEVDATDVAQRERTVVHDARPAGCLPGERVTRATPPRRTTFRGARREKSAARRWSVSGADRLEHDGRAVAAARAPDTRARERRRAREVQARDGRLVAGELGVLGPEHRQRAAGEARRVPGREVEVALVHVGRHRPVLDDRVEEARFAQAGEQLEPAGAARSEPGHPPVRRYGVYSTSRLSTWRSGWSAGAIVGSSTVGTFTRSPGRSSTRPCEHLVVAAIDLGERRCDHDGRRRAARADGAQRRAPR